MDGGPLSRRDFIKGAMIVGAAAAVGVGVATSVLPVLSGTQAKPSAIARRSAETGLLVPITLEEFSGPAPIVVTGEWDHVAAVVYKVATSVLRASSQTRGYNTAQYALQHPTEPDMSIIAYDGRCTHLGCTVGFNKGLGASKDVPDYDGAGLPGRVLCPCHSSQFDIYDLGRNLPGQPAKRPLDVLSIGIGVPAANGAATVLGLKRVFQSEYRMADHQGLGKPFKLAG